MLMKSCGKCGRLIPYGKSFCPTCEKLEGKRQAKRKSKNKKEYDKRYNAKRDPKIKRFYNSPDWIKLSQIVMRDHDYKCDWCGKKLGSRREDGSTVVLEIDHIEEIKDEWDKRFDKDNLRCLCTKCHNIRHKRFLEKPPRGGSKSM